MYSHKTGIVCRKLEKNDLDVILNIKNESWWGTHRTLIANKEDQLRWYEKLPSNSLYMTFLRNNTIIGICGYTNICHINRVCQISGSSLHATKENSVKDGWNCGLDFAFEILNMHRVEAEVLEYNYPAQKLNIQYLGMVVEGRKRAAVYKSGKYYDSLILGLLRQEWEVSERVKNYNGSCNLNFDHDQVNKMILRSERYLHHG